jgi:hypothetical protein
MEPEGSVHRNKLFYSEDSEDLLALRPTPKLEDLYYLLSSSFLGSTAQLRPWPPPQNPAEFLGGFSTIFFFTE